MIIPAYRRLIAKAITKVPMTSAEIADYVSKRNGAVYVGDVVDYLELVRAKKFEYEGKIYYYFD